jgi:hypothetical protein
VTNPPQEAETVFHALEVFTGDLEAEASGKAAAEKDGIIAACGLAK